MSTVPPSATAEVLSQHCHRLPTSLVILRFSVVLPTTQILISTVLEIKRIALLDVVHQTLSAVRINYVVLQELTAWDRSRNVSEETKHPAPSCTPNIVKHSIFAARMEILSAVRLVAALLILFVDLEACA